MLLNLKRINFKKGVIMKIKFNNKKIGVPNHALAKALQKHKSSLMTPKKGKGSYKRNKKKGRYDDLSFFLF